MFEQKVEVAGCVCKLSWTMFVGLSQFKTGQVDLHENMTNGETVYWTGNGLCPLANESSFFEISCDEQGIVKEFNGLRLNSSAWSQTLITSLIYWVMKFSTFAAEKQYTLFWSLWPCPVVCSGPAEWLMPEGADSVAAVTSPVASPAAAGVAAALLNYL